MNGLIPDLLKDLDGPTPCHPSTGASPQWWDSMVAGETPVERASRIAWASRLCDKCPIKYKCFEQGLSEQRDGNFPDSVYGGVLFANGAQFKVRT